MNELEYKIVRVENEGREVPYLIEKCEVKCQSTDKYGAIRGVYSIIDGASKSEVSNFFYVNQDGKVFCENWVEWRSLPTRK